MYYNPTITRPDLLERLLEFDDAHLEANNIADKIHWPTLKMCMEEMKLSLLNINDYKWMINRYNNFVSH